MLWNKGSCWHYIPSCKSNHWHRNQQRATQLKLYKGAHHHTTMQVYRIPSSTKGKCSNWCAWTGEFRFVPPQSERNASKKLTKAGSDTEEHTVTKKEAQPGNTTIKSSGHFSWHTNVDHFPPSLLQSAPVADIKPDFHTLIQQAAVTVAGDRPSASRGHLKNIN